MAGGLLLGLEKVLGPLPRVSLGGCRVGWGQEEAPSQKLPGRKAGPSAVSHSTSPLASALSRWITGCEAAAGVAGQS